MTALAFIGIHLGVSGTTLRGQGLGEDEPARLAT
jgi:hypothetical protein